MHDRPVTITPLGGLGVRIQHSPHRPTAIHQIHVVNKHRKPRGLRGGGVPFKGLGATAESRLTHTLWLNQQDVGGYSCVSYRRNTGSYLGL